jgi:NADH-quinone oxidoreductase subunit N
MRIPHGAATAAMKVPFTHADWAAVLPVSIVAVAALVVLIADLFSTRREERYLSVGVGLAGTILAALFAARQFGHNYDAFFGGFMAGGFATVFQEVILIALAGSLVLYAGIGPAQRVAGMTAIMLWSACGAMLMAGAANLLMIFLGLELLSLGLYALCGAVDRKAARESALKYLILSSTATGFLLFGSALLFGATGSVQLSDLVHPWLIFNPLFWTGAGMFLIGLVFKLSLVPFHTWTPDVFEGAPLPVTAFMSVATKAGVLAVFARFIYAALPSGVADRLLLPVWIIAGISMIVGNVGMLAQHDLKRLLGYSGIAQVGYILVALAGVTPLGLRYAIYYLMAYAFMNLGAFAVAAAISGEDEEGARLSSYRGLARRRPWLAAGMTVFLLALAGLPPTAGFLGKILILATSASTGYLWLAALLIVGTAISLYAYAKIIRAMYGRDEGAELHDLRPFVPLAWASAAICAVLVVAMAFYPLTPSNILPLVR